MSNESDVRLVAVVVCDVDGSTELRSRLGEEEADAASDKLQRGLRAVLIRFGATSVHSTGDGL